MVCGEDIRIEMVCGEDIRRERVSGEDIRIEMVSVEDIRREMVCGEDIRIEMVCVEDIRKEMVCGEDIRIEIGKRRRDRSLILNTQMVSAVFLKKFQVKSRLFTKPKYIELIYRKLFTLKKDVLKRKIINN